MVPVGGAVQADEPAVVRGEALLVAADGSVVAVPTTSSITSETVDGVTTFTEIRWAGVSTALLAGVDDELTPPEPTDLVVPLDDPTSPVAGFEPPPGDISDDELRQCENDPSYGINVCLKMTYTAYNASGGRRFVRLLAYAHRWIRNDTSISWSNAFGRAGVTGYSPNGKYYSGAVIKQVGVPASNDTAYTHKPSWTGVDIEVSRWKAFQAANSEITLRRHGSTWTFVHSNVYQGSYPGW